MTLRQIRAKLRSRREGDGARAGNDEWRDVAEKPSWVGEWLERADAHVMVDVELETALPWEETRRYEYSKLYVATDSGEGFSEECVVCFPLVRRDGFQRMRVALPETARQAARVQLRLDPFPFCETGRYRAVAVQLVDAAAGDEAATRLAELRHLKQQVRRRVEDAEAAGDVVLGHLPESLSLELTPRCNLTCGHCGTHGTTELHKRHNAMAGMQPETLTRLADEVFPSLTAVTVIGRGEPLLADDATWQALLDALRRHGVMLRFVTNGTLLRRRLTPEVMPLLDTITVSIDGNSEETMQANRGGVRLEHVLDGVRHYHELRRDAGLARRPRLCLSWTLKRNNIHEFPDFVERVAEFEPDVVFARHLLIYFEREESESLLGEPALANPHLRRAYAALERLGIRGEVPSLMDESPRPAVGASSEPPVPRAQPHLGRCPFIRRTAVVNANGDVPTCTVPVAPIAGNLMRAPSFADIWNGDALTDVRGAMDTPGEWEMCRNCYNREGHWAEQRAAAAKHDRYDHESAETFTEEAWNYRRHTE